MRGSTFTHTGITTRLAATIISALALAPGRAVGADDPERFHVVPEWRGSLSISGNGSGDFGPGNAAHYRAHASGDFPLTLKGFPPGSPLFFTWNQCLANYIADLEVHVTTSCDSGGTEFTTLGSGPLSDPGGSCLRVDLTIFPSTGETPIAIMDLPLMGFDGTEHLLSQCPDTDLTYQMPVGLVPGELEERLDEIPLPDTGLGIHGTWSFRGALPHPEWGAGLVVDWLVVLDLSGEPQEDELIIVPGEEYPTWIPEGKESEDQPGNEISVYARVQKKGGGFPSSRAKSFRFELVDTSAVPGVCMNFPPPDGSGVSQPDLQFTPERHQAPWKPFAGHGQSIETEEIDDTFSPIALLTSFDWGGSTMLKATAVLFDGTVLVGHLESTPDKDLVPFPKRAENSKIADAWKSNAGASGKGDASNGEAIPEGDGHDGDGLTLYEEYRGFYVGTGRDHLTGDHQTKDLFIRNRLGSSDGVKLFKEQSRLAVHDQVQGDQLSSERVINFNHTSDNRHRVDQHALDLKRFGLPHGIHGSAEGGPGLPKHVTEIRINSGLDLGETYGFLQDGGMVTASFANTVIAHELFHAANVYHHGRGDLRSKEWTVDTVGGALAFMESAATPANLITEDGRKVHPTSTDSLIVYMGIDGGECSGDDHCIMRYIFSRAYHDHTFPAFPYYYYISDGDNEPLGTELCSKRQGTGVNGQGRTPQTRYADAGAGCCRHQICVNDAMPHSARSTPTACAGGGEAPEPPGPRPGGGELVPQPIVTLAVNESAESTAVRGWPILIAVEVRHSQALEAPAPSPLSIAPSGGSWRGAIQLTVRSAAGAEQSWPITPSGNLPAKLVLDGALGGRAGYWISPEDSETLAAGAYIIEARLDTTGAAEGWIGEAEAPPATIAIIDAPAPLPPDLEVEGLLHLARYRFLQGNGPGAQTLLDEVLAKAPGQIVALAYKGAIRAASGDRAGAISLYQEAIDRALAAEPDAPEAPGDLLLLHGDLQAAIIREGLGNESPRFVRGSVNEDRRIDISDAVATLGFLFLGSPARLACQKSADFNNDEEINITDGVALLSFLFIGGAPPAQPYPACGTDPTTDQLPCGPTPDCP